MKKKERVVDRMGQPVRGRYLSLFATTVIILLMFLYLALTTYSSAKLAKYTEDISSHPFEVVIAAGEVRTKVSEMRIRMERLTKHNSLADIRLVKEALAHLYLTIEEPIEIIEKRYRGDPEDVEAIKETLKEIEEQQDACALSALGMSTVEIGQYEEEQLYPLYTRMEEQVRRVITSAQTRKVGYGEIAEKMRRRTLIGSIVLMTLMVGGLVASQYVLHRQRRELLRRSLLFDNLSLNIDDSFLIRDALTREISYTGLNIDRVLGRRIKTLSDVYAGLSPSDAEEVRKVLSDPEFDSPYVKELEYTFENSEKRWISVRIYRAENMNPPQIISVFSDCTEERKSRQALQEAMESAEKANEAKSVFLSRMSHEIRTPLNAIIGMTTIASASTHDAAKIEDCLEKIGFSSKHLLMLINDVLDMSKIESNKMVLQQESFDLFQVINSFVSTIYAQAKGKNISFRETREGFHGLSQYRADALRLNQILLNLGSNAVKFTPPGGKIELKVSRIAAKGSVDIVRFVLSDTGIGMSKEALERIYKPFEQADETIAGRFGGTGLGMSITRNLVTLMDGRIEIQSEEGKGTTCIVDLPIQRDEEIAELPDFRNESLKALIVDDEETICVEIAELLDKIKIKTEWVLTGSEAVERVTKAQLDGDEIDFCLIDWKMPEMDGIEVTRRIRASVGPYLPIVIISAYDYSGIEEQARLAGANGFLPKPLYRSSVYGAIKAALSKEKTEAAPKVFSYGKLKGRRILVAEDNEINQQIVAELLLMHGMKVECVSNGQEAVEMMEQSPEGYFDAILMDVQMPVLNGHEAAKRLRMSKHPDGRRIPIIATTANAFSEDVSAALAAGMNAHIAKPIDFEELCRLLGKLI